MNLTDSEIRELIADAAGLKSRERPCPAPAYTRPTGGSRTSGYDRKNDERRILDL